MPLMRVDVLKGHDEAYLKQLLKIAYEVQGETLHTPERRPLSDSDTA